MSKNYKQNIKTNKQNNNKKHKKNPTTIKTKQNRTHIEVNNSSTPFKYTRDGWVYAMVVRDSSAFRRLFVRLAGVVGLQTALHKENSGFATATLRRHILFSIRNPCINRFTNHFSIHS